MSAVGTMTRRNLLRLTRTPQVMVFSTIQPVLFVVLFDAVFGGSISTPGGGEYIDFLIPGIMIHTTAFASMNTGLGMAEDLENGAISRFRSLPIPRHSILLGRTNADVCRAGVITLVVLATGAVFGFRPTEGPINVALGFAIALLLTYVIQWAFVFLALMVRSSQGIQAASFAPTFPLVFASSSFAPVDNMPSWLQGFAKNQPVTVTVDSIRGFFFGPEVVEATGRTLGATLTMALGWYVGIFGVFFVASSLRFRKG